ncbi:hypothetical protein E4U54_006420 [Claviceps lovelessii]|nr:hypothetical protein E4U54_006420 [Claviceps lovelessii]
MATVDRWMMAWNLDLWIWMTVLCRDAVETGDSRWAKSGTSSQMDKMNGWGLEARPNQTNQYQYNVVYIAHVAWHSREPCVCGGGGDETTTNSRADFLNGKASEPSDCYYV